MNSLWVTTRRHPVFCPYCATPFDLFARLGVRMRRSLRTCVRTVHGACQHPAYQEPHFWKQAPAWIPATGVPALLPARGA